MKTILFFILFSISFTSCSANTIEAKSVVRKPKNIILIINDGMGPQQLALLNYFYKYSKYSKQKNRDSAFDQIAKNGEFGLAYTTPFENLVIDSAASATQIATGKYSRNGMIGLDFNGEKVKTVLELAKEKGMATGLVSDTRITHATPASFAAHTISRDQENEIANQLLDTSVDVMFSGGLRHFIPKTFDKTSSEYLKLKTLLGEEFDSLQSKRTDEVNLLTKAETANYQLVFNRLQLEKIKSKKVLGLFTNSAMPDAIWYYQNQWDLKRTIPTLKEMTQTAVEILSKNKKGFFLMVEPGQIDWAGHQNDAGTLLHQLILAEEVVEWLYNWSKNDGETVIVVTSDHETGNFGFSYSSFNVPSKVTLASNQIWSPDTNYVDISILDKLYEQKMSYNLILSQFSKLPKNEQTAASLQILLNKALPFNVTLEEAANILTIDKNVENGFWSFFYGSNNDIRAGKIARVLTNKQSIVWGTGGHTSTPVGVFSYYPDNSVVKPLQGLYPNIHIGSFLNELIHNFL